MDYISGDLRPRQIPKPTCYNQGMILPAVPDISLFSPSENMKQNSQSMDKKNEPFSSYNKWKLHTDNKQICHMNSDNKEAEKENICGIINDSLKTHIKINDNNSVHFKKVRFENTNPIHQIYCKDLQTNSKTSKQIYPETISRTFQEKYKAGEQYSSTTNDADFLKKENCVNYPLKYDFNKEYPIFQRELDLSIMEPRPPITPRHYSVYNSNTYTTSNCSKRFSNIQERDEQLFCNKNMIQFQTKNKTNSLSSNDDLIKNPTYQDWVSKNCHNLKNMATITADIPNHEQSTEHSSNIDKSSISEIYKMIQIQNEQLKSLQMKIEQLLNENSSEIVEFKENKTDTKKNIAIQTSNVSDIVTKNPMTVSIGLMTSLEFIVNKNSIQEMNYEYDDSCNSKEKLLNSNKKVLCTENIYENSDMNAKEIIKISSDKNLENTKVQTCELQYHPKIHQADLNTENKKHSKDLEKQYLQKKPLQNDVSIIDNNNKVNDYSFTLNDITELPEVLNDTSVSHNSLHIELQEFNNSKSEASDVLYPNIGWTIYNNVVGQVRNILEKSSQPNPVSNKNGLEQKKGYAYNDLLEQVKNATLQHLCNLGISLVNTNTTLLASEPEVKTLSKSYFDVNDMSIEVNQLIMKYFHNDQLNELIVKSNENQDAVQQNELYCLNGKNEVSFSTMKYMQKYNLLEQKPKSHPVYQKGNEIIEKPTKKLKMQTGTVQNKILDITALKRQPKLL